MNCKQTPMNYRRLKKIGKKKPNKLKDVKITLESIQVRIVGITGATGILEENRMKEK